MAITPKAVALAMLLGGSAATGIGWAQTATPPAADAAAAPAGEVAAPAAEGVAPAADAAAPAAPAAGDPAAADAAPAAEPAPAADAAPAAAAEPAPADAAAADGNAPAPNAAPPGPAASAEAAVVGQYYVEGTHGDWTLRCIKAPEGTDPCELYQLLKDANGNSVSEFSMIPLTGEAAAGATIVAPLETDLVAGLGLKVDAGRQAAYPFNFCAQVGCVARVGFTQAELDTLKRGNEATISLLPYGVEADNRVDLKLSLRGFTAGMDAVAARMPPPQARTD